MRQPQESVQPHIWTEREAYASGMAGYRICVPLGGNPFTGTLAAAWMEGHRKAASIDPHAKARRVNYSEERSHDRRDRRQGRNQSRNKD